MENVPFISKDVLRHRVAEHPNRAQLARETGIHYRRLDRFANGKTPNPGSDTIDTLRVYFAAQDAKAAAEATLAAIADEGRAAA